MFRTRHPGKNLTHLTSLFLSLHTNISTRDHGYAWWSDHFNSGKLAKNSKRCQIENTRPCWISLCTLTTLSKYPLYKNQLAWLVKFKYFNITWRQCIELIYFTILCFLYLTSMHIIGWYYNSMLPFIFILNHTINFIWIILNIIFYQTCIIICVCLAFPVVVLQYI